MNGRLAGQSNLSAARAAAAAAKFIGRKLRRQPASAHQLGRSTRSSAGTSELSELSPARPGQAQARALARHKLDEGGRDAAGLARIMTMIMAPKAAPARLTSARSRWTASGGGGGDDAWAFSYQRRAGEQKGAVLHCAKRPARRAKLAPQLALFASYKAAQKSARPINLAAGRPASFSAHWPAGLALGARNWAGGSSARPPD